MSLDAINEALAAARAGAANALPATQPATQALAPAPVQAGRAVTMREALAESAMSVWDGKGGNDRRRAIFPGYKNRPPAPQPMLDGLNLFRELLSYTPAWQARAEGFEGDDVIAALVEHFKPQGLPIEINTRDGENRLAALGNACGLRWSTAVTLYLEEGDLKNSSADGYASIGGVVQGILGDFDLGTLTQDQIRAFCQSRRKMTVKPHGAKDTGRRVSDQTIRNNLSMMSAVYKHAMDMDLPNAPKENPFKTFDRSFLKSSKRVDRHVRPNQFQMVLDACYIELHRRLLIVLVGTGMRTSDVCDLWWPEIDFGSEFIEFGNIDPNRTKTSRSRRITMLPVVREALLAQRTAQMLEAVSRGEDWDRHGLVFPSPKGGRRYDLKYLAKIARNRAGVKGFWVHGLRHTFASWALQNGLDPEAIRLTLGHATLSTTSRYAHHVPDSVAARIRAMAFPVTAQNTAQTIGLVGEAQDQHLEKEK